MMRRRTPTRLLCVKQTGSIVNTAARLPKWSDKNSFFRNYPSSAAARAQSMGLGIKALNYSASVAFGG
jgi:hypothetical protein